MAPLPPIGRVRDPAPAALAALLAFLASSATGLLSIPGLPSTPGGFARLALATTTLAFLALGPAGIHRGPRRVLALALAALPALLVGLRPVGALPGPAWWLLLAAAAVLGAAPRHRRVAVGAVAAVLAVLVVVAGADAARWVGADRVEGEAPGVAATAPRALRTGVREGAPVRPEGASATPLGAGDGPWWVEAERATHPGPRPVVLLVGIERPSGGAWVLPRGTVVAEDAVVLDSAHVLRPFDAVVLRETAWGPDDPAAAAKARALAGFVRGGGLLVGPAPDRPWPPSLGPLLGQAGRARAAGPAGVRRLGLGRVARAGNQHDVAAIFAADLWVRDLRVTLLDPGRRAPALAGWTPWEDRPGERRPQGWLLWLHVLGLAAFGRLLRAGAPQLGGILLVSGVVAAGLAWIAPQDPGFRVEGAFVDLGGRGGRRVEGVWISAGPRGYRGHVRFEGEGVVGLRGASLDAAGRVWVPPGRTAWVVRETRGRGPVPEEPEDRRAGGALALLRGPVDPGTLRVVRREALPVRVEGWGPVPAVGVVARGGS